MSNLLYTHCLCIQTLVNSKSIQGHCNVNLHYHRPWTPYVLAQAMDSLLAQAMDSLLAQANPMPHGVSCRFMYALIVTDVLVCNALQCINVKQPQPAVICSINPLQTVLIHGRWAVCRYFCQVDRKQSAGNQRFCNYVYMYMSALLCNIYA